jgi:hypothetical protein
MGFRQVDFGFTTADGESVELAYSRGELRLTFIDWREEKIQHIFEDVFGFKWEDAQDIDFIRDDRCYEILESDWLKVHIELNAITDYGEYSHYKLCFNAYGTLDVLCKKQKLKITNGLK